MAKYRVTDSKGKSFVITGGDTPPTQELIQELMNGINGYKEPETKAPVLTPLSEDMKAKPRDTDYAGIIGQGALGFGQGVLSGLGRVASGASLGATDWLDRKLGGNLKRLDENLQRSAEQSGLGGLNKVAKFTTELGGNVLGLGGKIVGGLAKGSSALAKSNLGKKIGAKALTGLPLVATASGIEGGIQGATASDKLSDLPVNIASGSLSGAVMPVAFKGLGYGIKSIAKPFTPSLMTEGMQGGLSNVVNNPDAVKLLNRGIRQSDDIANDFLLQSRPTARGINKETANMIDDALTSRINVPEAIKNANARYGQYMDVHGRDQIFNPKSAKEQAQANFDRFFEGSKVVDESGKPLTYYHGSLRKFDKFKQHNGDYNFSPDKNFAYDYAENKGFEQGIDDEPQLYSVFLNSKRPFDINNVDDLNNLSNYIKGKKIRVYGNEKSFDDFIEQAQGKYYDTPLMKGEFEKLDDPFFNKWYSHLNEKLDYEPSSVTEHKILEINKPEEYFIAGQPQWGLSINDVEEQVKNQLKDIKWLNNKARVNVDVDTPYGKRVNYVDLIKVHKPSPKNLKEGADNWITLESADFDGEDFQDVIKKMGYDGYYKTEKGVKNLSVFNPNQIKSINNSGGWSDSTSLTDPGWKPESSIADLQEGLNSFQSKSLKQAIARGGDRLEKGSTPGSVDHFNKIKQDINAQIGDLANKPKREGDVRLLEILKQKVDSFAPEGLKRVDKGYEKAKRLEDAFERGKHYNPNNVDGSDYIDDLSQFEKNAFTQGLFKRINNNSLSNKNLANTALGYENTLASVLRGDKYNDLIKGLNNQSTRFERLAGLGRKAESKLNTPEAQRFFGREQLESKGSLLGSALDWANSVARGKILTKASKNLLNPYYNGELGAIAKGISSGNTLADYLIRNNPVLGSGLSAMAVNNMLNQ